MFEVMFLVLYFHCGWTWSSLSHDWEKVEISPAYRVYKSSVAAYDFVEKQKGCPKDGVFSCGEAKVVIAPVYTDNHTLKGKVNK